MHKLLRLLWICKYLNRNLSNDAKNRYGFEHICHHQAHSLLLVWLLTCLAMTIERLYRIRYLHRGTHPVLSAISLWQILWLSLSRPAPNDTS